MTETLAAWVGPWAAFFGEHGAVSIGIAFLHVGGMLWGGGRAVTADLLTLRAPSRERFLADGVSIDKANEVILVRHGGSVYAFALSCPHQNTALRWNADEGRFQCPKHKSRYQPDGTFISGRATRNMDRLPIRREGGNVVVDVDRMFESDKDEAGWKAAVVAL